MREERIYAIIVTYNGRKWMDYCLNSLQTSSVATTTIVVDNHSMDGSIDYIRKNYPEVILLPQNQNLGFGQANNIGIMYALEHDATHILLLNQDAAIQKDTLAKLLEHDDGKNLLTPIHLNGNGQHVDVNFYSKTICESTTLHGITEEMLLKDMPEEIYPISYVNAACWFLPANIIRQVGGFNPLFLHYGEDDNYIHRITYHTFGLRLVADTYIWHDREQHGNEKVYREGLLYRRLLLVHTNINNTGIERCLKATKLIIQNLGRATKRHYLLRCLEDFVSALRQLIHNRKEIHQSRTKERKPGLTWLTNNEL